MYGTGSRFGLGDALDDVASDPTGAYAQDPQLAQLHQLALILAELRQEFTQNLNAAADPSAPFDPDVLVAITQEIQDYAGRFNALRASIDQTTANQYALSSAEQALLDVGTWAQQTIAILPSAIGAVPNALVDGLAGIVSNVGTNAVSSLAIPALAIGALLLGVIAIAKRGEQTRTGRALARRL